MEKSSLYILNLQPDLHSKFFSGVQVPEAIQLKVFKTYRNFIRGIKSLGDIVPNILLFLPANNINMKQTREIRLTQIESPIYVVTEECSERDYLTFISLGISGVFHPPFNRSNFQRVVNGRKDEEIPFPRSNDLIEEGQVRLDFLIPSRLSRILGVNRLVSFLTTEFGFPPEDCKVNLPMVMDEALSNAIIHGNKNREDLKVHIRIYISFHRIIIQVEDQGEGFVPESETDPTDHENVYKGSGRGLYLIRELMDEVEFKKDGRVIEMKKKNAFGPE